MMNKFIKTLLLPAFALGLAACGSNNCPASSVEEVAEVTVKAFGYTSSAEYIEYTDLGGYGSDFTRIYYTDVTLYSDATYLMEVHNFMYAGSWSIIATETDARVYGTYTTTTDDEYSVIANLSAATRVVSANKVTSSLTYNDTDDIETFTATEEKTAEDQQKELLASYAATTIEIDHETHGLTIGEKE